MSPLLVFSHLRWNFVYQRPQHLLARLARHRPVLFVEEPVPGAAQARAEIEAPAPGVQVLRPLLPGAACGFADEHLPALHGMLEQALRQRDWRAPLLWLYTPMAWPLAARLPHRGVVFDCMDELSAFLHAPPELLVREQALIDAADLLLTGGPSLYAAKRARHPDVHCLPSSVDAAHFAATPPEHASQRGLPRPRLGYYGVIDERLDLALLAALADARTAWQIVMVGPVVKIDPASLPRRPNLHWLGPRDYAELPSHLCGWDVCLLPFALNEATRFISPTKTLEYLAAGRPCVSTPIRDVAEHYAGLVAIAADASGFVAACSRALAWSAAERDAFAAAARARVASTSWDGTVARIETLLARLEGRAPAPAAPASSAGLVQA